MAEYTEKQLIEMEKVWKEEIALNGGNIKTKNKPMTIEEEYKNSGDPMPNDMLNASNSEQFKNNPMEKDDRGDLDLTKLIDIQNKEIKDLMHDNTILLEEVKRLVKKINELNVKNET